MIIEYKNAGTLVGFRKHGYKKFYYRPAFENELQRDDCFRDMHMMFMVMSDSLSEGVELEFVEVE